MVDPFQRYHVTLTKGGRTFKTTVSLDKYLSHLLAVSLGERPDSPAGRRAVRRWLMEALPAWGAFDPELPVSRQATVLALRHVARPEWVTLVEYAQE